MERYLTEVCHSRWNEQQDAGRPWDESIHLLSAEFPVHTARIAAYRTRWDEMLSGPIHDSVAILHELRARGVRLYALTNWSNETFPLAFERYAFLHVFEGIVVSGAERLSPRHLSRVAAVPRCGGIAHGIGRAGVARRRVAGGAPAWLR